MGPPEVARVAFDERLAERVRGVLKGRGDVEEKKMFGGLCFMVAGKMCCGIAAGDLMFRVGPEQYEDALKRPGARPMDFTGRPLKGLVYVSPAALRTERALAAWVERSVCFAESTGKSSGAAGRRKAGRARPSR